jgi:ferritin-like protein
MIRLFLFLMIVALCVSPALSSDDEGNGTEEYVYQELVIISFDEEFTPDPKNTTQMQEVQVAGNQTRIGGEMTARKLFELREGAKEDYRKLANISGVPYTGLPSTSSQGVSIICKQCVPTRTEI